jgi:hypothetical protein
MVKPIVIIKYRRGPQGPARRTLRRAIRPSRVKIGIRVAIFLVLLTLLVGWIAISFNRNLEKLEHEHLPFMGP